MPFALGCFSSPFSRPTSPPPPLFAKFQPVDFGWVPRFTHTPEHEPIFAVSFLVDSNITNTASVKNVNYYSELLLFSLYVVNVFFRYSAKGNLMEQVAGILTNLKYQLLCLLRLLHSYCTLTHLCHCQVMTISFQSWV